MSPLKRTSVDDSIKVTVNVLGGRSQTVCIAKDATVAEALAAAEMSTDLTVRVNGEECSGADELEDGDELFVASSVKGGNA